jgi:hypothetical protein
MEGRRRNGNKISYSCHDRFETGGMMTTIVFWYNGKPYHIDKLFPSGMYETYVGGRFWKSDTIKGIKNIIRTETEKKFKKVV